jgi:hypothetical protein
VQIAPNWRVFVRAFVSADDRLNVTDRFDAVVSAPKIPFPGNRDRTTILRPSNYPLRIAFLSGYNSRDEGSNVSANRAAETGRKGGATTPKAKREARKAARVPLSAAGGNRRWLSGRFLTSWFWIKKIATNMSKNAIWSLRK